MKILAIETSCDETAVSLVKISGPNSNPKISVLAEQIASQITIHQNFGGVVPMLAKRAHAEALPELLLNVLEQAGQKTYRPPANGDTKILKTIAKLLDREPQLFELFQTKIANLKKPNLDAIAVTRGPGLEPALWVGINFAKALAHWWQIKLVPTNHLTGHLFSPLINQQKVKLTFPAVGLIASGGHTELILLKNFQQKKLLGQTRDDAAGEAFDKVARLLGLNYPGGPEIAKVAAEDSSWILPQALPRPMLHSADLDFSFSGLKTAVLYLLKKITPLDRAKTIAIARDFQQAVAEILAFKLKRAAQQTKARCLLAGGGVIANQHLRQALQDSAQELGLPLYLPANNLTGDNATMIAVAAYFDLINQTKKSSTYRLASWRADGNLPLS